MNNEASPLLRLELMGFQKVGEWRLEAGQINCFPLALSFPD
jgi:hypothetical protein